MGVTRRLAPLTLDNLGELPEPCRRCLVWELDPLSAAGAEPTAELEKEAWLSTTLLHWGSCGVVAYNDDQLAGYLTYAPAGFVPRSRAFPTSPISLDAVLLMTGGVVASQRGRGIARMLVQGVAKDLTRRGIRALEAFATTQTSTADLGCTPGCQLPASFLLAVGFKTVRAHRDTPRLRLDLRTVVSWREDVEHALERILGTVRVPTFAGALSRNDPHPLPDRAGATDMGPAGAAGAAVRWRHPTVG